MRHAVYARTVYTQTHAVQAEVVTPEGYANRSGATGKHICVHTTMFKQ